MSLPTNSLPRQVNVKSNHRQTNNCMLFVSQVILNTLRPRQNGRHLTDDILNSIFLNENVWIPIKISLKFVPKGAINNIPSLVQIMAWRRPGDKPLSEPMMVSLTTHICVTLPQWVKASIKVLLHRAQGDKISVGVRILLPLHHKWFARCSRDVVARLQHAKILLTLVPNPGSMRIPSGELSESILLQVDYWSSSWSREIAWDRVSWRNHMAQGPICRQTCVSLCNGVKHLFISLQFNQSHTKYRLASRIV